MLCACVSNIEWEKIIIWKSSRPINRPYCTLHATSRTLALFTAHSHFHSSLHKCSGSEAQIHLRPLFVAIASSLRNFTLQTNSYTTDWMPIFFIPSNFWMVLLYYSSIVETLTPALTLSLYIISRTALIHKKIVMIQLKEGNTHTHTHTRTDCILNEMRKQNNEPNEYEWRIFEKWKRQNYPRHTKKIWYTQHNIA